MNAGMLADDTQLDGSNVCFYFFLKDSFQLPEIGSHVLT